MESLSFRLIETTRRLKEEITSATEEHFELTEKKVFDAYNSQKETNRQFETELRVLREKVIGSAQSGGGLHSAQDDLGELLRLKKNGSILEGISSALLNQVVKECKSTNAIQFADREETDGKIASIERQITDAIANIQRKQIQDMQLLQKMNPASRDDI